MTPDVSVIIVNFNTRELLEACLESLYRESGSVAMEVFVVDNGSSDGSAEMIRRRFPETRLVLNTTNEGFARPNNAAIRRSAGRYLFLLNSDTVVLPGAIGALVAFLDGHPGAGACGPRLRYPDGRQQHSVRGFPTIFTHFCDMLFLDRLFPRSRFVGRGEMRYFNYDLTQEVDHITAAAFLVRRKVVDRVGDLDEHFAIYYNDMDWCFRIKHAGWSIWYVREACIVHHLGSTVDKVNRNFALFDVMYDNVMLFYQKHYGRGTVAAYKVLMIAGFSVRAVAWTLIAAVRHDRSTGHMRTFCWKTLGLALPFWTPLGERPHA
jgi:N-acetylglucosaminyl-diphospho-decaprenol L-rhamnosyltransferase